MDLVSHEFHLGTILYLEIRGGGDFSLAFQVLGGKLDTFQRLTFSNRTRRDWQARCNDNVEK